MNPRRSAAAVATTVLLTAAAVFVAPTASAGPPSGGCPPSTRHAPQWDRVLVQDLVDAGLIVAGAQSVDLNGNGFTCAVFPPNQVLPTIRDDTVPSVAQ